MSSEFAIRATNLGKTYRLYAHPLARLRQMILPGGKKHYREFHALQDVNFEIKRGETVGIIGRNGSGKSTLLQLICGILKPTTGSVEVNGRVSALLELGAGFHPEFTGRENVYMQGAIMGLTRTEMDARFADIAAFADIGDFIEQPVKTYSSGMFVRLAFAVAVHVEPDILVVDEALAVGDALFVQKCMRFLRSFKKVRALVLVSHDIRLLTGLADRVLWLEAGHLREFGPVKDICEAYHASLFGYTATSAGGWASSPIECRDSRQELFKDKRPENRSSLFRGNDGGQGALPHAVDAIGVEMRDQDGQSVAQVFGGEVVTLLLSAIVQEELKAPIMGFLVKDRVGQAILGDNTYLTYADAPVCAPRNSFLEARFRFCMPRLPAGTYSLSVAVADGTQDEHRIVHWQDDALLFVSGCRNVADVLVGIPMLEIVMQRQFHRVSGCSNHPHH